MICLQQLEAYLFQWRMKHFISLQDLTISNILAIIQKNQNNILAWSQNFNNYKCVPFISIFIVQIIMFYTKNILLLFYKKKLSLSFMRYCIVSIVVLITALQSKYWQENKIILTTMLVWFFQIILLCNKAGEMLWY